MKRKPLIKLACGCVVCVTPYKSHELIFCPIHKAAPDLLDALLFSYNGHKLVMHHGKECDCRFWDKTRAAIAPIKKGLL